MKSYTVHLSRKKGTDLFNALNSDGYELKLNGLNASDGGKGVSPMELLLMGAGGCAGIDIICLLRKQKIEIGQFDISIRGSRIIREKPAYFRIIRLDFIISSSAQLEIIIQAIKLSLNSYCTVVKTLNAFSAVKWSLNLNGEDAYQSEMPLSPSERINLDGLLDSLA